ncbi:MAG: GHKL domain-containing protein [Phycisphaerales bacterium]|jgi:signal transduction histidine kinase|nr:GHKL domain-containing protein [Phycisphaerales bacterium]MBT7171503.1 GHKL domain-containing protein [Phycisphaerales bacterium]
MTQPANNHDQQILAISQIVGGLAHEIKNPLSTINLNLNLLAEDLRQFPDDEHRRILRRLAGVQQEAQRMCTTLDDFLRFAGKVELQRAPMDLRDLLGELHDFFLPQAEGANIVLRYSPPAAPLKCNLDVNLIKQAILNLLLNAIQAMEPAGRGELLLGATQRESDVVIEITDTGPGIDAKALETIFTPYFSTKSEGSGLGLPTARRIVHEHGGTIDVQSEPGRGTQFTIILPTNL